MLEGVSLKSASAELVQCILQGPGNSVKKKVFSLSQVVGAGKRFKAYGKPFRNILNRSMWSLTQ